ncbi:hypothetical protein CURE108131_10940 [Cupriavidus respiraculi]|uniref:Entry exclusion lipoprotein TrbK n=1 Tax=Cupriavidus respiraculi TaxID=195930 RepID=A0ABM8WXP2_9BURK|nr:hypothetical protein [Cupriavidus respiraculi]CAG9172314.1 hypothetical protein LMG21510_01933 [Cupriavidus respiraculi]
MLTVLVTACAAPAPPPPTQPTAAPAARYACPPLPTLPRGSGRKAMLAHIDKTAAMYADCATRER